MWRERERSLFSLGLPPYEPTYVRYPKPHTKKRRVATYHEKHDRLAFARRTNEHPSLDQVTQREMGRFILTGTTVCTVFCILRLSRAALQFRHRKQTRIHGYTYICTYITSILGIPQVNTHVDQRRVYQKAVYTPNQRVKSRIRAIKTALNRGCTVSDLSGVRVRGSLL